MRAKGYGVEISKIKISKNTRKKHLIEKINLESTRSRKIEISKESNLETENLEKNRNLEKKEISQKKQILRK